MAQAEHSETVQIELERGKTGLGFNIRGGIDIPHIGRHGGIFVAKIRENGTAAQDGRLKNGDLILEINGQSLSHVTHNEAVAMFVKAGDHVNLRVLPGAERIILAQREDYPGNNDARQEQPSSSSTTLSLALGIAGIAVVVTAVIVGYKYYKGNS